jgi:hypothetical protein
MLNAECNEITDNVKEPSKYLVSQVYISFIQWLLRWGLKYEELMDTSNAKNNRQKLMTMPHMDELTIL